MIRKIIAALALVIMPSVALAGNPGPFEWPIVKVVDGDTIQVDPDWLPEGLKLSIRVLGVDTPEKAPKAKCDKEAELGKKATEFTTKLIKEAQARKAPITFTKIEWDKFGGRMLAYVNVDGKDLTTELINNGLARKYNGEKKSSWCD